MMQASFKELWDKDLLCQAEFEALSEVVSAGLLLEEASRLIDLGGATGLSDACYLASMRLFPALKTLADRLTRCKGGVEADTCCPGKEKKDDSASSTGHRSASRISKHDLLDTAQDYLPDYKYVRKLEKAFRENSEMIEEFIESLPDPDMTLVGAMDANYKNPICLDCLTNEEKAQTSDKDSKLVAISRDDAEDSGYTCARCGKGL
ncbi:MAG: hypothetical protein WAW37_14265 [Syntrophobacteraceae bacterium]